MTRARWPLAAALAALAAPALAAGAGPGEQPSEPALLGADLGGLRPVLAGSGLDLRLTYIGEAFGSVTGGARRGAVYEGQLGTSLDVDLEKLAGWKGGKAHISAFAIHGHGPSTDLLAGNLMRVSNIEALPTVRLNELWLEQALLDDRLSVRAGQIAGDAEFITSSTAGGLINGTFGWPLLASADMTGGGPNYPLPTPGVRVEAKPSPEATVRAAAFSGNPGGQGCTDDPEVCNRHGTAFSLSGGTLWLAELEYAAKGDRPGAYKLGAWRETGSFPDERTGALDRHGDWGVYAIADRVVWRAGGDGGRSISVFARGGAAPDDRNLVSWYVDGGVGGKGLVAGRPDDVVTLGAAYGRISDRAAAADRAAVLPTPVRDFEAVVELSYIANVVGGWTVQPDLQYVIHPGANAAAPNGRGPIGDALVLGLRTTLAF